MKNIKLLLAIIGLSFLFVGNTYAQNVDKRLQFCSSVKNVLFQGNLGNGVRELQWMLQQDRYGYLQATDYFGPVTAGAVRSFQRNYGIRQTGAVGPITLSQMRSVWCTNLNIDPSYLNYPTNNLSPIISINPISSDNYNVTLAWNTQNANSCILNNENVSVNGNKAYTIYNETSFRMVCYGNNNTVSEQTLLVKPNQNTSTALPTVSLYLNPQTFYVGQNATINWSSSNANSCTLNNQSVNISGLQNIYINNNPTSYSLSCTGNGGTANQTITTNASNGSNICTAEVRICADGSQMQRENNCAWRADLCPVANSSINSFYGTRNILNWNTTNAASCTLQGYRVLGGSGAVSVSVNGNLSISDTNFSGNYILSCLSINGTLSTKQITIQ